MPSRPARGIFGVQGQGSGSGAGLAAAGSRDLTFGS